MSRTVARSAYAAAFAGEPWPGVGICGIGPPGLVGVDPVDGPLSSALAVKELDGDRSPNRPGATLSALLLKLAVAREAASSKPLLERNAIGRVGLDRLEPVADDEHARKVVVARAFQVRLRALPRQRATLRGEAIEHQRHERGRRNGA